MITAIVDLSRAKLTPYAHQVVGVEALVSHPHFALFDTMGIGKTKQVIDAFQVLFEAGTIDRVLVVCPAAVRSVWYDETWGELRQHLWDGLPAVVSEFHANVRQWSVGDEKAVRRLSILVTNYDYFRERTDDKGVKHDENLKVLLSAVNSKTLLVLDESSAVKSHKAAQTKACLHLRKKCGRIVLLNGTPISHSPADMFAQGLLLDPAILGCPSFTQFCSRYAEMKPILGRNGKAILSPRGFVIKKADSWKVDDIQKRFAPFVLRRLKEACLDLPKKLPPVVYQVALTDKTWNVYKEMRDELCVWLSSQSVSTAPQAVTKIMRLAQITSGFLGGVEDIDIQENEDSQNPARLVNDVLVSLDIVGVRLTREVGREKLDFFLQWLDARLEEDPSIKVLVWSRFRAEILRLERELKARQNLSVGTIIGGQKRQDREHAIQLLDPRTCPNGPVVVIGNVAAGGMGLNLTASHTVFYLSNSYSLKDRLQSSDRVHRPGQTEPVWYGDLLATGPKGQKTIDFTVLQSLSGKDDLATMTCSAWVRALREE